MGSTGRGSERGQRSRGAGEQGRRGDTETRGPDDNSLLAPGRNPEDCGTGTGDPLGRGPGEALDPERYDEAALAQLRATIGNRDWAALFQQEPRQDEGNVFKRPWLQYVERLPECRRIVVAWDTAYESKESSDFTAAMLVAQGLDGRFYVQPLVRERLEFPELVRVAKGIMGRFPQAEQIVEARASGKSLRQQLRSEGIPLIDVEPEGDKVARAYGVTRFFEGDLVRIVLGPGVDALEHELLAFPRGAHDDQVDGVVYGLLRCAGGGSGIHV
jgi:predicted phage terminase large subunit-like protein